MLFHGPPGVGKTMLAERVPGLLPDLEVRDALEVSAVHSLAGFNLADELITRPPFSDPHHSASVASIVGGGQRMAKPGAISCDHAKVSLDSKEAMGLVSRPPPCTTDAGMPSVDFVEKAAPARAIALGRVQSATSYAAPYS
jgi:hypothetical protein